jgi:hypothetical protein
MLGGWSPVQRMPAGAGRCRLFRARRFVLIRVPAVAAHAAETAETAETADANRAAQNPNVILALSVSDLWPQMIEIGPTVPRECLGAARLGGSIRLQRAGRPAGMHWVCDVWTGCGRRLLEGELGVLSGFRLRRPDLGCDGSCDVRI